MAYQRPTSGQRFPRQVEEELIAWLVEMFRRHGTRFLEAQGIVFKTMRAFLTGHRIYSAFRADPEAWHNALQALVKEFGQEAVDRFLEKLGATERSP